MRRVASHSQFEWETWNWMLLDVWNNVETLELRRIDGAVDFTAEIYPCSRSQNCPNVVSERFQNRSRAGNYSLRPLQTSKFSNRVILTSPMMPKMDIPQLQSVVKFFRHAMKTNKNSCDSWDIRLSNAPTPVPVRPLEKSAGHSSKKTGPGLPFKITAFTC